MGEGRGGEMGEEGDTEARKASKDANPAAGTPPPSVGLIHSDRDVLACLWGKTSTGSSSCSCSCSSCSCSSSSSSSHLTHSSPLLGQSLEPGWGLLLWISGDRWEFAGS